MSAHLGGKQMHPVAFGRRRTRRFAAGFTLIEILVVVAIIALLVAILLPSLARARANAKTVICTTQIQQLMKAALMYKMEYKDRLPGTGINDTNFKSAYDSGTRKDWLSWSGIWHTMLKMHERAGSAAWTNVPRGGRLWRYYKDEKLLLCPAMERSNGKLSYSTPENVSVAMKSTDGRVGLPPVMDKVKHPAFAIQFLDEDDIRGIVDNSLDDGFGADDIFTDRHLGKAPVAFFDGHASAHYFPRGKGDNTYRVRYNENKSEQPFMAEMIQIAPFNSPYTTRPWKIKARSELPSFYCDSNYPPLGSLSGVKACVNR